MKRLRHPFRPLRALFTSLTSLLLIHAAFGWVRDGAPIWPDGTVTLRLLLGDSPTYSDGTTPNGTAIEALKEWNPYMSRVQLAGTDAGSGSGVKGNGTNDVFFAPNVYGQAFDTGVLAITLTQYTSTTRYEADVVVNSNYAWDSYRGGQRGSTYDLRRVLAHEFGHVLGLDHPDEHGQVVTALMNSTISTIETPQADDQAGVASMYGAGTGNTSTPPTITTDLQDLSVYIGDDATFRISATGTGIAFQWQKDGSDIAGANQSYYTIKNAQLTDAGNYSVTIKNSAGSVTSRQAKLTVSNPPPPTISSQPSDVTTYTTLSASFYVYAIGRNLTYQWQKDDVAITGATNSSLNLTNLSLTDAGQYSVVVTNPSGSVTSREARLTVNPLPPPVITTDLRGTTVRIGTSLWLELSVNSPGSLTFQWYKDSKPIANATSSWYSINTVSASDGGDYYVVVSNAAGSVTSATAHVVIAPMAMPATGWVRNVTATLGQPFQMDSTGAYYGGSPTSYQWYHNGKEVAGQTFAVYYGTNATYADSGEYYVAMTNSAGTTLSDTGYLTVLPDTQASASSWLATCTYGSTVYFLFNAQPRIERFDMSSGTWLSPISIKGIPVAITVNSHGIFVGIASSIDLVSTDGASQTPWVADTGATVQGLASTSSSLIAVTGANSYSTTVTSYSYADGHALSATSTNYGFGPILAADPNQNLLFSVVPSSYSEIARITVSPTGILGTFSNSDIRTNQSLDKTLTLTPDGKRLIGSSGTVYSTTSLATDGSVSADSDVACYSNGSVATLAADGITLFDNSLHETGWIPLSTVYQHIAINGTQIFVFGVSSTPGTHPIASVITTPPTLTRPTAAAIDPTGVALRGDTLFVDKRGVLYIYSKDLQNLFRWSPATRSYIKPSIPLQGAANSIVYSPDSDRIYIAYADDRVTQIRLDLGETTEVPFVRNTSQILGLCAAGPHIFLADPSGAWNSFSLFDTSGTRTGWREWAQYSREYIWDPNLSRIYYYDDGTSPNNLQYSTITATGQFTSTNSSYQNSGVGAQYPIRVSPDGSIIVVGTGELVNAATFKKFATLPSTLEDAVWLGTTLYSANSTLDGVRVDRWGGAGYSSDATITVAGRTVRMFADGTDKLLLVVLRDGVLHYVILDKNLNQLSDDGPGITERMIGLSSRASVGTGDNIMVSGFVIQGLTPKQVVVRAIGPSLVQSNIANPMADPQVTIYDSNSQPIAGNDNFGSVANLSDLEAAMSRLGLSALPDGSRDAAMLVTLKPGLYTAQVSGVNNGTGVGLLEIYDADEAPGTCRMTCLSSRAQVGTGDNILVSGFIISGAAGKTLLIRADGPSLSQYGVSGVLANPQIKLFQNTTQIASNDDWCSDPTQVTAIEAAAKKTGLFALPEGSKDSAILIHLKPGLYTAQVSGSDGGSGVAMLEVYEVPQ